MAAIYYGDSFEDYAEMEHDAEISQVHIGECSAGHPRVLYISRILGAGSREGTCPSCAARTKPAFPALDSMCVEQEEREAPVEGDRWKPMEVAIALALYRFNVSAYDRAFRLNRHFHGACMPVCDITDVLDKRRGFEATELPYPIAKVYVQHALEADGDEARTRVRRNEEESS